MTMSHDGERINLKEVLMTLGNRLVTERGFDPGSVKARDVSASTKPISEFTEWLNNTDDARGILASMGIDWPVVESLPPTGELFHAQFQGTELPFEVVGCAGEYLKCQGRWQASWERGGGQVISMLIGEQHVRSEERKRFRETIVRMGGVVDGGQMGGRSQGGRTEAGRIGGDTGDGGDGGDADAQDG